MASKKSKKTKREYGRGMTLEEVLQNVQCSEEHDNDGQLVLYTGVFRHKNGLYYLQPEVDLSSR
jgi:hypothetical protein